MKIEVPSDILFKSTYRRQVREKIKAEKKKKKQKRVPKPKTDWIHTDVDTLTPIEIKKGLQAMARSVHRNVDILNFYEHKGIPSPAIQFLNESGGQDIHSGGFASVSDMKDEFVRAQNFLKHEQHTKAGYDKWFADYSKATSEVFKHFDDLTEDEQKDRLNMYWRAFNRMKQVYPWIVAEPGRTTNIIDATKEEILEDFNINTVDEAYDKIMKFMEDERENLPSAIKSSDWTYAPNVQMSYSTPSRYRTTDVDFESEFVAVRGDMRTKEFRSPKYKKK